MEQLCQHITARLAQVLPAGGKTWPLHEPQFTGVEATLLQQCLDDGMVSSIGPFVEQFAEALSYSTQARYVIPTVNGTAALHICLQLAGVKAGDEVLTPALSFVATSNAIHYCAATPHFVDSDPHYFAVDAGKLQAYLTKQTKLVNGHCVNRQTGRTIRALCVVHVLGHPAHLTELNAVCQAFNIALVEDAAEALGSYYQQCHVGHQGLASALSFNGNKIITTGGGGAILTNDAKLAQRAHHLTTTAKCPHAWEYYHDTIGYNYRMPNLNAALGLAQLAALPEFIQMKRRLAHYYQTLLADITEVRVVSEPPDCRSNYWLNALVLSAKERLSEWLQATHDVGLQSRPLWHLHHQLPMFQHCPRMDLTQAEQLVARVVCLPSSVSLAQTLCTEQALPQELDHVD